MTDQSRRDFLKSSALLAAAGVASMAPRQTPAQESAASRPLAGGTGAVFVEAETLYGKVQGVQTAGIKEFNRLLRRMNSASRDESEARAELRAKLLHAIFRRFEVLATEFSGRVR